MASSHHHDGRFGSQNLGNAIGTKSCVRQSRHFREYESGNFQAAHDAFARCLQLSATRTDCMTNVREASA